MTRLYLIPEPASIEFAAGSHTFNRSVAILISENAGRGEWLAAQQVQAALSIGGVQATVQPQTRSAGSRGDIILAGDQRNRATFPNVSPHPHWSDASAPNEAYRLTIEADRIVMFGAAPPESRTWRAP